MTQRAWPRLSPINNGNVPNLQLNIFLRNQKHQSNVVQKLWRSSAFSTLPQSLQYLQSLVIRVLEQRSIDNTLHTTQAARFQKSELNFCRMDGWPVRIGTPTAEYQNIKYQYTVSVNKYISKYSISNQNISYQPNQSMCCCELLWKNLLSSPKYVLRLSPVCCEHPAQNAVKASFGK